MKPCYVFWHKWSQWEIASAGNIQESVCKLTGMLLSSDGKPIVTGRYVTQIRKCSRCGLVKIKMEKT